MSFWHDSEARKNFKNVFNRDTLEALYQLADSDAFQVMHGFVKEGKESNVCVAEREDGTPVAVKIYMVEAGNYQEMEKYLLNDPRFENLGNSHRDVIHAWCRKEFKNLKRASNAGVSAPEPIDFLQNVLVMEFIGDKLRPAPRVKDVVFEEPEREFEDIIEDMRRLWQDEDMVHGDLSEYNLLWKQRPYMIDLSQAVVRHHPLAEELLERDVENVVNHFNQRYGFEKEYGDVIERIQS
ncbi:MAG: serine protein kinase RIO [Candidatus Nanohaloarchaea archaeon]|nr:serine protein kinase RIO [Candidatus Nanohaloarchaea archaeon]